jgi:glycosyltransferase involved in cell wall biosynthesis
MKSPIKTLIVGKRRFDERIIDGPVSAFEALLKGLRIAGIKHTTFPQKKRPKLIQYILLVVLLFRHWDHINVHLNGNYGLIVGLMRLRKNTTSLTVHGYSRIEGVRHPYNEFMHALQVKYLFRNRIFVSSEIRRRVELAESLKGGVVIPNAVDVSRFGREVRLVGKDVDVFSLCGYSETKGVRHLLSAAGRMSEGLVWVIGGQNYVRSKVPVASNPGSGRIELRGQLTDAEIADLYSRARVYVQPSDYESYGIPVVEAMFLGIPTVVSKGAGVAEFLTDEVDSLLVAPRDVDAFLHAIRRLLTDKELYEKISGNAKYKAMELSTFSIAKKYQQYFESLAQ